MKNLLCSILISSALISASPASAQEVWKLSSDQARCVISNLPEYQKSEAVPIVIFVQVCPTVDRMEALQALQQNSSTLPRVTVAEDGTALDQVIVYTAEELLCLKSLQLDLDTSPVLLPQKPCSP